MVFGNQILDAIKQIMPTDSEITSANSKSGIDVSVCWKLNDDPERPNKMSKTISIHCSQDAVNDYESAPPHNQAEAYRRIVSFISQKLDSFNPTHNASRNEMPPVELWVIDSTLLFSPS